MTILVSPEDEALLVRHPWKITNGGYVIRYFMSNGVSRHELLHRVIIGALPGQVVDHINGDPLDCRRENLRICSHAENMRNRRVSRSNSLGVKGVYRDQNRFRAQIDVDKRRIRLGSFRTVEAAKEAYRAAALLYHGEFAKFG